MQRRMLDSYYDKGNAAAKTAAELHATIKLSRDDAADDNPVRIDVARTDRSCLRGCGYHA
jgi:hypothetical protein